ncbi:MAG: hypothetical protein CSA40_00705 [Flavobacteriales bacterium]|nr:MAG: hypothetical protein CSA40_00705 [Flavobacteriales bacterium]
MTANRKLLPVLLISLYFVLALSSCQWVTKVKEKAALKAVLERQRTDKYITFSKDTAQYKSIIADKTKRLFSMSESYESYIDTETHYEGTFYNQAKDTVFFLSTLELWIKKNVKVPDTLKKDINKKYTITVCFLGIKQHNSIVIQHKFQPIIYFNEKYSKKRIYTEKLKQRIFDKFVDHVLENRRVSYDKAYFNDSVKENDNLLIFKPLYDLIGNKK